jgi:transcriptional regulator GlxA family with amidase domain
LFGLGKAGLLAHQPTPYSEPAAFRRMFAQIAGMTPVEYRSRFTVRTPRAIWKVESFDDVLKQ